MTEVPARLSIVTLGVRNMSVLRSFYRSLGWRALPIGDEVPKLPGRLDAKVLGPCAR
jgi:hypothetical protein